jgi:hypothetical protein
MMGRLRELFANYRNDIIVLILLVAGFALNIYAPIWFAPPYFAYTTWIYVVLFFAWVPAYLFLIRPRQRPGRVALFVILGMILTSCSCMVVRPSSVFAAGVLDNIQCEQEPTDPGQVRYACTRNAFEGPQYDTTYIIQGPNGSPILFLVEIQKNADS